MKRATMSYCSSWPGVSGSRFAIRTLGRWGGDEFIIDCGGKNQLKDLSLIILTLVFRQLGP